MSLRRVAVAATGGQALRAGLSVAEIQHAVLGYRHEVHAFSRDLEADGRISG